MGMFFHFFSFSLFRLSRFSSAQCMAGMSLDFPLSLWNGTVIAYGIVVVLPRTHLMGDMTAAAAADAVSNAPYSEFVREETIRGRLPGGRGRLLEGA